MKNTKIHFSFIVIIAFGLSSCSYSDSNKELTSFDVSTLNEVTIGSQLWLSKNLSVDKFRNGDCILEANTKEEWVKVGKNKQAAWCYYDNDPANGDKYGKLYNWYAVNDPRGLAPEGWHVPSDEEWTTLTEHLDGEDVAGTKMKSRSFWEDGDNGTNESGFTCLPSGSVNFGGEFFNIGRVAIWWSSTEYNVSGAWNLGLRFQYEGVDRGWGGNKNNGYSVRCIKD